jgi:microcystin-dependent protein
MGDRRHRGEDRDEEIPLMADADIPNTIQNNTPADAAPVQQNYAYIEQFINSELINRDGSVAMVAPLALSGDPVNPTEAATKGYVDAIIPVGLMLPYLGDAAPAGNWLLAQGQSLATSVYPALFAVLGYRYGGGGANFNLPDMRHRFPIGKDAGIVELDATGKTGGTTTVPVPQHNHTIAHTHEHVHTHPIDHDHAQFDSNFGGDHVHNLEYNEFALSPAAGEWVAQRTSDVGTPNLGTSTAPAHQHAVNVPAFVGTSGAASDATTGGSSAANSGNTGTAGATMRPEFVVVNYIVRTA